MIVIMIHGCDDYVDDSDDSDDDDGNNDSCL